MKDVYLTVLDKLCVDHFHTALDIAQTGEASPHTLPAPKNVTCFWNPVDPKQAPVGYFCTVVGNINTNMHLIEKLFRETIMPCI